MSEPRSRLERAFAPELVDAVDEMIAARVDELLARDREAEPSPWRSIPQAAAYLRVSERTIERWIARGRLRSTTVGRRRLLHRDDLDNAAAGEETAPTAPPRHR